QARSPLEELLRNEAGKQRQVELHHVGELGVENVVQCLPNHRMIAADAVNTEPGQEVEVAVAFLIPEVRPLGPDHLAVETDRVEHARHLMVEMFLVQSRRLASALVDQRTDVEPNLRTILLNGTR